MQTPDQALAYLNSRAAEHERLLAELVEINSYSDNKAGGDLVADRLLDTWTSAGMRCTRHPSQRYADHLVAETAAADRGGHILCIGHHDTVFPPGTFEGYRREGPRAFGPGVLDMKGGLVVITAALEALCYTGALERLPLRLISVGDEEVGSPESQPLVRSAARDAVAALGFESGRPDDGIVTARKGTTSRWVRATGKAAHAGNAHAEGANAIWALCRFVEGVQSLTDYDRGVTVNVGTIRGGTSKNTVPEHAEAQVDLRFERTGDAKALEAVIDKLCSQPLVPGTRLESGRLSWRFPLERTDESVALATEYGACQERSGLGGGEHPLVGGGSDAATAAAEGVPAIDGLGPRGRGFHTPHEWIDIGTVCQKAEALVRFLWARLPASPV